MGCYWLVVQGPGTLSLSVGTVLPQPQRGVMCRVNKLATRILIYFDISTWQGREVKGSAIMSCPVAYLTVLLSRYYCPNPLKSMDVEECGLHP